MDNFIKAGGNATKFRKVEPKAPYVWTYETARDSSYRAGQVLTVFVESADEVDGSDACGFVSVQPLGCPFTDDVRTEVKPRDCESFPLIFSDYT